MLSVHTIKPHRIELQFDSSIPKKWYYRSQFGTYLLNCFNLLFPGGEKFFLRTLKKAAAEISDRKLLDDIKGFIGQESAHSYQHEKVWDIMRGHGYDFDEYMRLFNILAFDVIEKSISDKMNLSITAGLEHFTAMLADIALSGNLFEKTDPTMKALYEWHCAEELDHKAVAFDALQAVDDSYLLRIEGMILATILLFGFSTAGVVTQMIQDRNIFNTKIWNEIGNFFFGKDFRMSEKSITAFIEYFDVNFHPDNKNNRYLAEAILEKLEVRKDTLKLVKSI